VKKFQVIIGQKNSKNNKNKKHLGENPSVLIEKYWLFFNIRGYPYSLLKLKIYRVNSSVFYKVF
jgi:hypothetical protein